MQVDALRGGLADFASALRNGWVSGLEPAYEAAAAWRRSWPPAGDDALADALDTALASTRSRALWQGHAYDPKGALIALTRFQAPTVRQAFGRLFSRELDLGARLRGFTHYLDELTAEYRRAHPDRSFPTHYHDDYRAPSLYCFLRYPGTDAYLEPGVYLAAMRRLRARDLGPVADPERFAKSVRVVLTFAARTEGLAQAHAARLAPEDDASDLPALLASEFFRFLEDGTA